MATQRVLRDCDLFFPSVDEVELLTGIAGAHEAIRWAQAHGARAVALKLGADGSLVCAGPGAPPEAVAPHRAQPVDATGAGDCFAGTTLARLCRGDTLAEAARWANAAAALSTQAFGAIDGLPGEAAVAAIVGAREPGAS